MIGQGSANWKIGSTLLKGIGSYYENKVMLSDHNWGYVEKVSSSFIKYFIYVILQSRSFPYFPDTPFTCSSWSGLTPEELTIPARSGILTPMKEPRIKGIKFSSLNTSTLEILNLFGDETQPLHIV